MQANSEHPVVCISWDEMEDLIGRLNEAAGRPGQGRWRSRAEAMSLEVDLESRVGIFVA